MVSGDEHTDVESVWPWIEQEGLVAVSVAYRLAPAHRFPTQVEDAYAALTWMAASADELGVDPDRIIVAGASAGGGLAAGLGLLARDRGGPRIAGQLLLYPMLDDRCDSLSHTQVATGGTWTASSNRVAWEAYLGDDRHPPSPYAAPGRVEDLSGLPPTYVETGSAELFRDEDVDFARRVWACGGDAELHVWPGAFHGFDLLVPGARISRSAVAARGDWISRLLRAIAATDGAPLPEQPHL